MIDEMMDESEANGLLFSARNLGVTRDRIPLLHSIDWTVRRGEHWVILGHNGSGKTSLLKCLMNYLTPTTGNVLITSREAARAAGKPWDEWRRQFGFVSASVSQSIEGLETGLEVVMSGHFSMINYWVQETPPEVVEAAKATLERVECSHLAGRPWMFLSQGERQRLLIGRALMARDLQLLVLDEPCAGLDPVAREHFVNFVQRLVAGEERGPTLILVTHHVEEIVPAVTHALVLKHGTQHACGPKAETITSEGLSSAFDADLEVSENAGRYQLKIHATGESVM